MVNAIFTCKKTGTTSGMGGGVLEHSTAEGITANNITNRRNLLQSAAYARFVIKHHMDQRKTFAVRRLRKKMPEIVPS